MVKFALFCLHVHKNQKGKKGGYQHIDSNNGVKMGENLINGSMCLPGNDTRGDNFQASQGE